MPVDSRFTNEYKYIDLDINNKYYRQLSTNIPVSFFISEQKTVLKGSVESKKSGQSGGTSVVETTKLKDTVDLGQISTDAYSYTLTVKMGKGFPEYYYDTLSKSYAAKGYKVDTVSINPKVKVKAGIPVTLYRKQKGSTVPIHEGDKDVQRKPNKSETRLIVAEGVTAIKQVNGVDQTIVVFRRLLCNLITDDEYYIQATLSKTPKGSSSGNSGGMKWSINPLYVNGEENEDDFLEAPEQVVVFDKKKYASNKSRYEQEVNYKLISSKPPMSEVSGKIVYKWPSKPGVIRPLPNAKFTVKVVYLFDGQKSVALAPKSGCVASVAGVRLNNTGNMYDPQDVVYNFQTGTTVGAGQTDAQGNFKLNIANYDPKGTISTNGQAFMVTVCPPKQQTKGKDVLDKVGGIKDPVINPWDEFSKEDMFGSDWFSDKLDKGNTLNSQNVITINDVGAGAFTSSGAGVNFNLNQGFNTSSNIVGSSFNAGAAAGAAKGLKGMKGGPSPIDEDEAVPDDIETGSAGMKVERVFVIEFEEPWGNYYFEPSLPGGTESAPSKFVVQAFDKKDLGTFTASVQEASKRVNVTVYKNNKVQSGIALSKAKLIVYRNPDDKPDFLPDGEGAAKHPMKPLIQKSMVGNNDGPNKEWLNETGFDISYEENKNFFKISGSESLMQGTNYNEGNYYMQIAPDPSKDGITFEPVIYSFSLPEVKVTLAEAKLLGRAVEETKDAMPIANARVDIQLILNNGSKKYTYVMTDEQGYFEYVNGSGAIKWDYAASPKSKLLVTVSKWGYKSYVSSTDIAPDMGYQKYYDARMEPGATITGKVVTETGDGLDAYLMKDDSTITSVVAFPINNKKYALPFEIKVAAGQDHNLTIIPEDPAYFDTTIVMKNVKYGTKDFGNIVMPKRLHRMRFNITRYNTEGQIIQAAKTTGAYRVTINNDKNLSVLTDGTLSAYVQFANASVNNYTVLIEDATGAGDIPQTINIQNAESREYHPYDIKMKQGVQVTGTVTLDGKPVKNARVYVDKQSNVGSSSGQSNAYNQMETRSGADGKYVLKGLPKLSSGLPVNATLDTSFTVNGSSKNASFVNGKATVDHALVKVTDGKLNQLWQFPLSVENIEPNGAGKYKVTGLVDISGNNSGFDWLDKNTKVRISGIPFKTVTQNGATLIVPEKDEVALERSALKMKYQNRYNVEVLNDKVTFVPMKMPGGTTTYIYTPLPLSITKSGTGGVISALTHIVDNSYNYPSSYINFENTGDFFLGVVDKGAINNIIPAISSNVSSTKPQYRLSDSKGKPLAFSFIGFNATAAPDNSYIDAQGKIHLDISFKGTIPNTDPGYVNVRMKDVVLDENKIEPAQGGEPISIKLDKSSSTWTLLVKDWKLDPQQGGLYSTNSVIQTGVVDIKAKKFNLRHNLFVLDDFASSDITLGNGLIKLSEVSTNAALVYDQKVGSDKGKHWRFNISPKNDGGVAAVAKLQDDKKLQIEYLQLISYANENIITLKKDQQAIPVGDNPYITFNPKTLSSNNGFFVLGGQANFTVPRMSAVDMYLTYSKGSDGKIEQSVQPFSIKLDGPGYVKFTNNTSASPTIDKAAKMIYFKGSVAESGKMADIPCTLSFGQGNAGAITFEPNVELPLTAPTKEASKTNLLLGSRMRGDKLINGMEVKNNDWSTLRFSGKVLDKSNSKTMGADNTLDFEVLGEITANSGGMKADQIPTPFGNVDMSFNFQTKELVGVMSMKEADFGSWKFTGDVEVRFSPEGWTVLGGGQLNTGTLLVEGFGTFSAGMLLGSYNLTEPMIVKTTQFSKDPNKGCWLQQHKTDFKGFYFTGGYDILNKSEGIDLGIAAAYFNAVLGVEASLGAAMGKNYALSLGAHGLVKAGLKAITGTSIKGALEAHLTAIANFTDFSNYGVDGKANVGMSLSLCQSYIFGESCWDMSKNAGVNCGFGKGKKSYFDFYMGNGPVTEMCNQSKQ